MQASNQSRKVLLALSGGVDSAVAALRLKEQGHEVSAAYMRTWMNEEGGAVFEDCPWEEDIKNAKAVAAHLGLPFEVVNLIDDYRERVVEYLVEGYRRGVTPNPDVMCNREMKFGVFRDFAKANGFEAVATGHYAQRATYASGIAGIREGADGKKDQSYFLALMRQDQVRDALFPIGGLTKPRVREIAKEHGLPNASRKDSQGICFLGKVKIGEFLEHYIEDKPGGIVSRDGTVLGEHQGLHRFTIGQRHGMGIPSNTDNKCYVVIAKDFATNQLIVAFDELGLAGLYETTFKVRGISWIGASVTDTCILECRPRYRDPRLPVTFTPTGADSARLVFPEAQRAIAPGQVAAFYRGDALLGGGFFA